MPRARSCRLVAALLPLSLTTACFATNSFTTAETVPKGAGEILGGLGWTTFDRVDADLYDANGTKVEGANENANVSLPFLVGGGRFGIADSADIGAQLYTFGMRLDFKYAFIQPALQGRAGGDHNELDARYAGKVQPREPGFSLAIDPTFALSTWFVINKFDFELPVLASYRVNDHVVLYGGARGGYTTFRCSSGADDEGDDNQDTFCDDASDANYWSYGGLFGVSIESGIFFARPEILFLQLRNEHDFKKAGQTFTSKTVLDLFQPGLALGLHLQ